jgi:2-hydroxymuconate-semialdehyde hydrolase
MTHYRSGSGMQGKIITVDGIRTHFVEMGTGPSLVLLHSGEFGGCSELCWEFNIEVLARHFHVVAPDWLGYGKTEKLFSFENMRVKRITHITAFLRALDIPRAHFVGNSMGGTMLLEVAAMAEPPWKMDRIVVVCGGGEIPDNDARRVLNSYDGSRDHMRQIVETMFASDHIRKDNNYIDRRHRISLDVGAWECTAAVRFRSPARARQDTPLEPNYAKIRVPVLIIAGELDSLRRADYGPTLRTRIPGAELHTIKNSGHCPQIDSPDEFNRVVLEFLGVGADNHNFADRR